MSRAEIAKRIVGVLVALAAIFLFWQARNHRNEIVGREEVQVVQHAGHSYVLYFHRRAKFFNTIRKDGVVVFDGRDHPELESCIQNLVVLDGKVHRQCHRSARKDVVTVVLP